MITNLDLYRAANVITKQYGLDAPVHAAIRADAALEAGDLEGYEMWKGILKAVEELLRVEPGDGERVN